MTEKPQIQVLDDHESLSRAASTRVLNALASKPDLLVCAAGGSTPLRTYDLLAEHAARQRDAFRSMRLVKLDEWGGLPMGADGTCEAQIRSHLVGPLVIRGERYIAFSSHPADPQAESARVHRLITSEGPIDLCVLGLGMNGHVAMNEPAAFLQPTAHVAKLTQATLAHPMLAAVKLKPTFGLTLGMAEILSSREILLLVSGAAKHQPLQRLLRREITTEFPASFLWLHPNWKLFCDRDATADLNLNAKAC